VAKALDIEKLKLEIARLRRQQYGRSSEKMARALEQFELRLEELEAEEAAGPAVSAQPDAAATAKREKAGRQPLPAHLPHREVVHEPSCVCLACGGAMRKVGEDVTEILDYVPGPFQVMLHVRPAFSCRQCESMTQAPMPSLPIERGRPGPGLLAHVLVAKYCDHRVSRTPQ
jgi:hypothetical protein